MNDDTLKLASADYVGELLEGKQDKLTSGENITIENNVISAAGGGGETKAKTWVCAVIQDSLECSFSTLKNHFEYGMQPDIESIRDYSNTKGIIKFTEEKSLVEVNKWLMFEAKITMESADGSILANNNYTFREYTPFAVCPWPEDKPWPESN